MVSVCVCNSVFFFLHATGFEEFQDELGPSQDSSLQRGISLDVSYDEQDIIKVSAIHRKKVSRFYFLIPLVCNAVSFASMLYVGLDVVHAKLLDIRAFSVFLANIDTPQKLNEFIYYCCVHRMRETLFDLTNIIYQNK